MVSKKPKENYFDLTNDILYVNLLLVLKKGGNIEQTKAY